MLEHYIGYAFGGVFIVAGFFLVAVGGRMCKQGRRELEVAKR